MYLFIFESIGTSELLLIGIVALIFLGPRRMPEYARKIGKVMADLRSTTNEFKETWQREVNFEEEARAFRIDEDDHPAPSAIQAGTVLESPRVEQVTAPSIREVETPQAHLPEPAKPDYSNGEQVESAPPNFDPNDRRNWL